MADAGDVGGDIAAGEGGGGFLGEGGGCAAVGLVLLGCGGGVEVEGVEAGLGLLEG